MHLGSSWPVIEGIDAGEARRRWAGDVDLFLSMLGRLIDEFGEGPATPGDADPAALAKLASAVHKFRGGACMLGATEIHLSAADLEAACTPGAAHDLPRLAASLAALVRKLRLSAGPAIAAARARGAGGKCEPASILPRGG